MNSEVAMSRPTNDRTNRPDRASARDDARRRNQEAVFQAVHRDGPISRIDIASRLQLSPAAVTNITAALIERGVVYESRTADATGVGRRAILLEVDYDAALVAGIKISNAGLTCALTNLNAEVLHTETHPVASTEPDDVVRAVADAFASLSAAADRPIAAIGVNLPGAVDADRRTVRTSPLLGWDRVPLGDMLTERLGVDVLVENDVNALAHAEAWFGHGREHDDFLVVTLGRGVGLGIVLNGEVYRGPKGGAGEFGHLLIDPHGPSSRYAKRGTLETYLSDDAIVRDAQEHLPAFPENGTARDVAQAADAGDPDALAVYERAGRMLGRGLSFLVDLFAPSLIVLSGEGMRGGDALVRPATDEMRHLAFGDLADHARVVVDDWGDDAWARGAAGLAASRFLLDTATQVGGDRSARAAP